jgi:hypothetical protein
MWGRGKNDHRIEGQALSDVCDKNNCIISILDFILVGQIDIFFIAK